MDILTALQVYKELADWYERQGQAAMRDRFLILAAEAAFSSGSPDEAERLRQRLLQGNPHHMLKPFSSFAQALQSANIQLYIHDLQVNYPPQTAEHLLQDVRSGAALTSPVADEGDTLMGTGQGINPLIEIRDEPTLPLGPQAEPLKVYPLRDEPKPTPPSSPPTKPAKTDRPAPRKAPAAPTGSPPPRPRSQTMPPRSVATAPVPPPPSPEAAPAGAWLTLILFGMTVTAGIALAFYTFARPFLPLP
jgi:hypothetical protein